MDREPPSLTRRGVPGLHISRQPQREARLGPRARLRRLHVADAAAGEAGGLRRRHRRDARGAITI